MMYNKLRFARYCKISFHGKEIECRIVYGNFPYGYGQDNCLIPQIVIDKQGVAYRPITLSSTGPWCIATDAYLKNICLSRKQIEGARYEMPLRGKRVTA